MNILKDLSLTHEWAILSQNEQKNLIHVAVKIHVKSIPEISHDDWALEVSEGVFLSRNGPKT